MKKVGAGEIKNIESVGRRIRFGQSMKTRGLKKKRGQLTIVGREFQVSPMMDSVSLISPLGVENTLCNMKYLSMYRVCV